MNAILFAAAGNAGVQVGADSSCRARRVLSMSGLQARGCVCDLLPNMMKPAFPANRKVFKITVLWTPPQSPSDASTGLKSV